MQLSMAAFVIHTENNSQNTNILIKSNAKAKTDGNLYIKVPITIISAA
jgi:hypothetical protein